MDAVDHDGSRTLTDSQRDWLRTRMYFRDHRYALAQSTSAEYPQVPKVAETSLLTADRWVPAAPIPLEEIKVAFEPDSRFEGPSDGDALTKCVRPVRAEGSRYPSYSAAMADLDAPAVFQDRSTYRLLEADLSGPPGRLAFGRGTFFDTIDVGESAGHEYAAARLNEHADEPLREAMGTPCDPARRPINVAISSLTVRHDRSRGEASFLLHWRDPAKVGHAGGLYQVVPVGIFQASDDSPWNERNDFSLWRCMIREYAEELLGESEDHGSDHEPIDYDTWPFAARMTQALQAGEVRAYCLGLGVDPLTWATDLLTAVVFDAATFDELFGDLVHRNSEGQLLGPTDDPASAGGIAFNGAEIERFTQREPMQAAGAALLKLAWQHRPVLLS